MKKKKYTWGDEWKKRKIILPKRKHLTIDELDKIPYIDENNTIINNKKFEREEQYNVLLDINNIDLNIFTELINVVKQSYKFIVYNSSIDKIFVK